LQHNDIKKLATLHIPEPMDLVECVECEKLDHALSIFSSIKTLTLHDSYMLLPRDAWLYGAQYDSNTISKEFETIRHICAQHAVRHLNLKIPIQLEGETTTTPTAILFLLDVIRNRNQWKPFLRTVEFFGYYNTHKEMQETTFDKEVNEFIPLPIENLILYQHTEEEGNRLMDASLRVFAPTTKKIMMGK
jgi:hypothetical protein